MRQPRGKVNNDLWLRAWAASGNRVICARMLLAADVGGTKTLLGLFARAPERPTRIEVGEFTTLDYDGLVPMIREFITPPVDELRPYAR